MDYINTNVSFIIKYYSSYISELTAVYRFVTCGWFQENHKYSALQIQLSIFSVVLTYIGLHLQRFQGN